MSREESKQGFKLWLLALALAIVLMWYILNPDPGPVRQLRKEDGARDGKRRQAQASGASLQFGREPVLYPAAAADEALPEWPKYIELY